MPAYKIGTKPRNFPGRINDRRVSALARIEQQLASGTKVHGFATEPLTEQDRARLQREGDALALRIRPAEQQRAIRTKKNRSGRKAA